MTYKNSRVLTNFISIDIIVMCDLIIRFNLKLFAKLDIFQLLISVRKNFKTLRKVKKLIVVLAHF